MENRLVTCTFGHDCFHSLQAFMTVLDVMHMEHTEAWEKEDPLLGTPSLCFISYKK